MSEKELPVDITPLLDYEIIRAQTVNCLIQAHDLLGQHNPQLQSSLSFLRVVEMHVAFMLRHNFDEEGERIYILKLLSPEGAQAQLERYNAEGERQKLDALDSGLVSAIAQTLKPTLGEAYQHVVGTPVKPTHPNAPALLQ